MDVKKQFGEEQIIGFLRFPKGGYYLWRNTYNK
jgi:hypothetical protein